MPYEPLVSIRRGEIEESVHFGAVVVADADGRVIASAGSPETLTFLRSSAKPFQALPLIESGAADHFRLTPAEIAIVIGSHSGEPRHLETVRGILGKIGLGEDSLMCGTHPPFHRPTARQLEIEGKRPSVLHSNCSGKHSGMLALALHMGRPPEGYFRPEHAVQRRILESVAQVTSTEVPSIRIGVDGCTVPTFGLTLLAAATGYARLIEPDRFPSPLRFAARRAVEAMTAHPEMVAGEGRLDTDLMMAAPGELIAKAGAEGYYAIAFRAGGRGYGLTLKVADGDNDRARSAILLRAVGDLGLLPAERLSALAAEHLPAVKSRRGVVVGSVEATFHLEPRFS